MESVKVVHVKLGRPPEGHRTIVFADGIIERNMLVEAEEDWNVHISIDRTGAPKRIFCLTTSPDGEEFKVTRMTNGELPKTLSFSGDGMPDALRGSVLDTDQNKIISSVMDQFKE